MNAVIALCHFCEAHGPSAIFCTQTLRDTKVDEISLNTQPTNKNCVACTSIGNSTGIISKDAESNANFLSTQTPVLQEVFSLIKQASVRSLSCEVSNNKNGGFVFFGDAARGHVLSHTFHISDYSARGFYRLFSIIILMKDKLFLLNIQPFLSENLERVSSELQSYAKKVYTLEQSNSNFERENLSSGQTLSSEPRSLVDLTAEKNVFAILHTHFTWILWAGARCLSERVTFGNLPWLTKNMDVDSSLVSISRNEWLMQKNVAERTSNEVGETITLRMMRQILGVDFLSICYCTVTGTQIVLRGPPVKTSSFVMCLRNLLPESMHTLTRISCPKYISSSDYRIIAVPPEAAVPLPCTTIFRIDFIKDWEVFTVKWPGDIPNKLPEYLTRIMKAIDEKLFNDTVLEKQLRVLLQEWQNKVTCLNRVKSAAEAGKLKKILGVQQHDQSLINYWSAYV